MSLKKDGENRIKRCIDPVFKRCQMCEYGGVIYPEWVETYEDTIGCMYETYCMFGYDQGRTEDEPTEQELKEAGKLK